VTKRLNFIVRCPGCKSKINPFIYFDPPDNKPKECQCPGCGEEFKVKVQYRHNDSQFGPEQVPMWVLA
jgi:rRNA maturation endonuclease Nob1